MYPRFAWSCLRGARQSASRTSPLQSSVQTSRYFRTLPHRSFGTVNRLSATSAAASSTLWSSSPSFVPVAHTRARNAVNILNHSSSTIGWRFYSTDDYPPHRIISLPALSPTMEKGNLVEWKKKEGDFIDNETVAVIETDKSTMEWEYSDEGYLAKILREPAEGLLVGDPLAVVVDDEESIAAFKEFTIETLAPEDSSPSPSATQPAAAPSAPATPAAAPSQPPIPGSRVTASPFAKVLAAQENVNLSNLTGSGPNQRIIAQDVLNAPKVVAAPTQVPAAGASFVDIPHTNIRKVIADRLTFSKQQIPHYYLTIDVRMDELQKVRAQLNEKSGGKYKLSVNDFVIKASALALKKVPQCNSSWNDESVRQFNNVDINVALNTDSGLLTPVIPNIETRGLVQINEHMKDLAERGREGKLTPTELSTGTFTISNLGGFGIDQFCAVINPPQACILAVGTATKKLIPSENPEGFEVAGMMSVTLSCDHRVVDGAIGAQWLQAFKSYLEDPLRMLL